MEQNKPIEIDKNNFFMINFSMMSNDMPGLKIGKKCLCNPGLVDLVKALPYSFHAESAKEEGGAEDPKGGHPSLLERGRG